MHTFFRNSLLTGVVLMATASAFAEDQPNPFSLSGDLTFASDYLFRGYTQTGQDPAVHASLTVSHESGFYGGIWGSNATFDTSDANPDVHIELDYYAGFSFDVSDVNVDLGYVYYDYPSASDFDWDEWSAVTSWKILSWKIAFSDNYFGLDDTDSLYNELAVEFALPAEFALSLAVGYQDVEDTLDSYTVYDVGLGRSMFGLDWALHYVDTDGITDYKDDGLVFSVYRNF